MQAAGITGVAKSVKGGTAPTERGSAPSAQAWSPAPGWEWDRNTTHKSGYLTPIGLFARIVPRPVNHFLAVVLGTVLSFTMRKTRRVLRHNLEAVGGGGFTRERIDRLVIQTFHNYGRYLVDFMYMTSCGRERMISQLSRFSGREDFEEALARGKGAILVTPHLGNWELGGVFLTSQGFNLNVVSLVAPDQKSVALRERTRERMGIRHLYIGPGESPLKMIEIVNALRRNEIVAMLCDRDSTESAAQIEFFGRPFRLPRGPAILAQVTGAAIIPSFMVLKNGRYEAFTGRPIRVEQSGAGRRDAPIMRAVREIAAEFEAVIRRFPDQWYNFYPSWGR